MTAFIIGVLIGGFMGIIAMALVQAGRKDDMCDNCRAEQMRIIRGLEETIHALKSRNGRLGKEVQNLSFLNSGFRAR